MDFLLSTLLIALPFIIPAAVLLLVRVRGLRWPDKQRPFLRAALFFYAAGLASFACHAAAVSGGLQAFLSGFYGVPPAETFWGYAGYAGQGLAAVCLAAVINWGAVAQIREGLAMRRAVRGQSSSAKKTGG